ncbi:hypothetical protein GPALN_004446 [Globodera pallida]|nr:hypothetical protein GPALN_004446 [Globodera pallida]
MQKSSRPGVQFGVLGRRRTFQVCDNSAGTNFLCIAHFAKTALRHWANSFRYTGQTYSLNMCANGIPKQSQMHTFQKMLSQALEDVRAKKLYGNIRTVRSKYAFFVVAAIEQLPTASTATSTTTDTAASTSGVPSSLQRFMALMVLESRQHEENDKEECRRHEQEMERLLVQYDQEATRKK